MGAARGLARVRREALAACMTCPLCRGLLREATAITVCLHTFCRECILEKINDEEIDCCPVCNIDLGCDPEEKLRPDHNLQDIRNKVFPIKKINVDSPKALTTLPAKRKQRSISSLVVDTPSVVKQTGLTGKRTKAKRRAAASLATSPVNNGTMKLPSKSENGDQKTDKSCPSQSTKAATSANKTENQDQKKTKKISAKQSTRAATPAKKKQRNTDAQVSSKPSSEKRKNSKTADKDGLRKSSKVPRSTPKIHAVNEEQIKEKEGEPPTRKGEADNKVVIPGTSVREHSNNSNLKEKNDGTSPEPSPLKDKTATEDSYRGSLGSAKGLHGPVTTPVWFSLISLPNQKEDPQLPQLPKTYMRIKDGSLQISSIQRYIMKKLDLANENEVEIICHGEPICPSSTLRGLMELWHRRQPTEPVEASVGAPAEEFVMVLGYRCHRRHPYLAPGTTVAVPPELPS
ncbi:E3 ubiquitin protein ligase DRIP2 [Zea mays]|uniref:RING-type domain-containing protein n=1 Tax=Zea mays TaxID=4577 RepID=A0A804M3N2_MAIZE|nr:E3 ubiquitin protein ligase DRIP2 [Zea mays]|eukprot:XP_008665389.1 E3 ubiquitin protein ligase DRIP2 [Zea mays]